MKTKIAEREYVCQGCGDVYDGSGAIVDNVDDVQTECDELWHRAVYLPVLCQRGAHNQW